MDLILRWFVWLCLEKAVLTPASFERLRKVAGDAADAVAYGETMLDLGLCGDAAVLQALLDEACDREASGREPPFDPFQDPNRKAISLRPRRPVAVAEEAPAAPAAPSRSPIDDPAGDNGFKEAMRALLQKTSESGASDLHLSAGARPFVRRDRELHFLGPDNLSVEEAAGLNTALLTPEERAAFAARPDLDFALELPSGERFRANLMRHKDGVAGTYRVVPRVVKSLTELGFRNAGTIKKLLSFHNGLILITGPVGSGKTTTLAALVRELNETRDDHLISVEEPIEVVHPSKRLIITQRAVGTHTRSFASALKGALRQDPDIIVIGEMRDLATIEMAISASETGHLVIGTMHTRDAATTLNRLLDVFPPAQQPQIRAMVAESLRGIVCQRLLPGRQGGLVLAAEILLRNAAVSALIREGKSQGLSNVMETGRSDGMVSMDGAVLELWRAGRLSDAVAAANIQSEVARREISNSKPAEFGDAAHSRAREMPAR